MLVYEYPVFKSDIKKYGFDLITFDDKLIYDENTKLLKLNNNAKIIAAEKYLRFYPTEICIIK